MHSIRRLNSESFTYESYPSKLHRGLWLLNNSQNEPMVNGIKDSDAGKLFYQSVDGVLGSIDYYQPDFFTDKAPIIVLLGPLLHPSICINKDTKWLKALLSDGHSVYCISHRGHHNAHQSFDSISSYNHRFESMVELDIASAINEVQLHTNTSRFHLYTSGLGTLLGLIWITMSGSRNLESLNIIPWAEKIFSDKRFQILCSIPNINSFKRLWNLYLPTQLIPSFDSLSLTERTALLHSDGWLHRDWTTSIGEWHKQKSIVLHNGILLKNALPDKLICPFYQYGSEATPLFNELIKKWSSSTQTHSTTYFPIVDKDFVFPTAE